MKRVWKWALVGCGTLAVLLVVGLVWLGMRLSAGAAPIEMSDHHPFRSAQAKEQYLTHYDRRAETWPVASESRMVATSQGRTFVRVSGPVDAPPLVLLPGANTTSMIWGRNIEVLSGHFRIYAVDNIYDLGRSVYTRHFTTPDDFTSWLDELFIELDLGDRIRLMGLSYGGWLTGQYTIRFPNRLEKIVLMAPAATVLPVEGEFLLRGALASALPHRYFPRSMMHWLLEDAVNKNEATRMAVDDRANDMFLGLRTFQPNSLVIPTVLDDQALRGINVPTLFLVGENEKIYSAQEAVQRLSRVAPQIETAVIPDAGHDLTIVQAELVNRLVVAFLERP